MHNLYCAGIIIALKLYFVNKNLQKLKEYCMKNLTTTIAIIIFLGIFLFIGINIIPFEKLTGTSTMEIMFIIFSVVLGLYLIGLITFVVINRRKKIVEVVEFSAPDNMTPADAGYVIDKKVDDKDISALLIYLAYKKYLEINKDNDSIVLKKLKDADDSMKSYEKTLFNAIFAKEAEVNLKDLPNILRPHSMNISKQIKTENNEKYFNSKISTASTWLTLGITALLVFLSYFFGDGGGFSIFCGIVIYIISTIFSNVESKIFVQKRLKGFILYIVGIVLFIIFAILNLIFTINNIYATILIAMTSLLCLLTYILCPIIEYRTKEGIRALGSFLGLKRYIELAEKEKMEKMVEENPELFYKVMPYAYVLNISNEWIDDFNFVKTINKKERKEMALALGSLVALCLLGEGASILGGLFDKKTKTKKQK